MRICISYCLIVILLLAVFSQKIFSQNSTTCDSIMNKANKLYNKGVFDDALSILKTVKSSNCSDDNSLLMIGKIYSILEEKDSAFKYINIAISNNTSLNILFDASYYNLINDPRWDFLVCSQFDKYSKVFGRIKNEETSKLLLKMWILDQSCRQPKFASLHDYNKQQEIDRINLLTLLLIVEKYGWLKQDDIGGKDFASAPFLIIQHSNINIMEEFLPLIKKNVEIGQENPSHLALLTDRICDIRGQKQIYGTQLIIRDNKVTIDISNIEDYQNLNLRRQAMGMNTIEEYIESLNKLYFPED